MRQLRSDGRLSARLNGGEPGPLDIWLSGGCLRRKVGSEGIDITANRVSGGYGGYIDDLGQTPTDASRLLTISGAGCQSI